MALSIWLHARPPSLGGRRSAPRLRAAALYRRAASSLQLSDAPHKLGEETRSHGDGHFHRAKVPSYGSGRLRTTYAKAAGVPPTPCDGPRCVTLLPYVVFAPGGPATPG